MTQSPDLPLVRTYYVVWAETSRQWRRIIFQMIYDASISKQMLTTEGQATPYHERSYLMLPNRLESVLSRLLANITLSASCTKISVVSNDEYTGTPFPDLRDCDVEEDSFEGKATSAEELIQDVRATGAPVYVESEVLTESRVCSNAYHALVRAYKCVERKAPFSQDGEVGESGFQKFLTDLKFHLALRDCAGIAGFRGIVVDDTRLYLRSYLHERPATIALGRVFTAMNAEEARVPWEVRERWPHQIVSAIAEIHRRALWLEAFDIHGIGLAGDGSAVLVKLNTSRLHVRDKLGFLPSELRCSHGSLSYTILRPSNRFRTNIFELAYVLWLLAEQRVTSAGRFCAKAACTAFPRFKCTAEHANPVELPPFGDDIPAYFAALINRCRPSDPKSRPPAPELAKVFPAVESASLAARNIALRWSDKLSYCWSYCVECGESCRELHYHCNVCYSGDFDICPACFEQGVCCFDCDYHILRKVVLRNRVFVDLS